MKVASKLERRRNQSFATSIGVIKFDDGGVAEVPDDFTFEEVKSRMPDVELVDDDDEKTKRIKELNKMTVANLKELANGMEGADKDKIELMKKPDLIDHIVGFLYGKQGAE